jgi:hypothetical protein
MTSRGRGRSRSSFKPLYCMYHRNDTNHRTKDCPIFLESKKKWPKTIPSLCHNLHPEKSIIKCSGHHRTLHTALHTLCLFPDELTQTITRDNLRPIINLTTMPQPTTPNLFHYRRSPTQHQTTQPTKLREPPHQRNNFPTHDMIHMITGGSNADFQNKIQQRDYYHQVNHVVVEGLVIKTKWSHIPITFSAKDINLASFPHTDMMVIMVHIDRWDVTRIIVDNESQDEVLFLLAFEKTGYDRR